MPLPFLISGLECKRKAEEMSRPTLFGSVDTCGLEIQE
jgi:hypothetical protein